MGTKTTGKNCWNCKTEVLATKNTPNHILHLILSIVTAGLWLPVWLIISLANIGGWRCPDCGKVVR